MHPCTCRCLSQNRLELSGTGVRCRRVRSGPDHLSCGGRQVQPHGPHFAVMYPSPSECRSTAGMSRTLTRCGRVALSVALLALAAQAPQLALGQTAAPSLPAMPPHPVSVGAESLARCERAVRQALVPQAGTSADVRFSATPPVPRSLSEGGQIVLQGEGQWREATSQRKFNYSCSLDARTGEAVGVVIRQVAPLLAAGAEPQPIKDPDLSHLSPSACESGAAVALQQRWPRASQITFDTETRNLTQQSASRAELRGQGRARPAPESPVLVHFGFDCTIDPRDGRVLGMHLNG